MTTVKEDPKATAKSVRRQIAAAAAGNRTPEPL